MLEWCQQFDTQATHLTMLIMPPIRIIKKYWTWMLFSHSHCTLTTNYFNRRIQNWGQQWKWEKWTHSPSNFHTQCVCFFPFVPVEDATRIGNLLDKLLSKPSIVQYRISTRIVYLEKERESREERGSREERERESREKRGSREEREERGKKRE